MSRPVDSQAGLRAISNSVAANTALKGVSEAMYGYGGMSHKLNTTPESSCNVYLLTANPVGEQRSPDSPSCVQQWTCFTERLSFVVDCG